MNLRLLWVQRHQLAAGQWNHARLEPHFWRLYQNSGEGGRLHLVTGDFPLRHLGVYLVPAELDLSSSNLAPIDQLFVHFDLPEVPPALLAELLPTPLLVESSGPICSALMTLREAMVPGIDADAAQLCQFKGLVYLALGKAVAAAPRDRAERLNTRMAALQPVLPALQHMQNSPGQPASNETLARLCHLSEDHFIRTFRLAVGTTPARYSNRLRLARAGQALLFTQRSIDQIAVEFGYRDRFYFSRVFAAEMGVAPARYRKGPRV